MMPLMDEQLSNQSHDFTGPDFMARNRQIRLEYIEGTQELERIIRQMRSQDHSSEETARRVVNERNENECSKKVETE